jgi:DNA-binding transcriptional ArsR family regulator
MPSRGGVGRKFDLRRSRFLHPYLGVERSVSQAAAVLGVSIARMAYQTARLVEAGLVETTRREPRAGRPIAFYRSTADEYVIALTDAGIDDFEEFELDAEEPLRRAFVRGLLSSMAARDDAHELAIRFRRLDDGTIDVSPSRVDGQDVEQRPSAWTSWTGLMLSPDDAKQLSDELEQLWARWRGRHTRGGTTHLLRLGLAAVTPLRSS